MLHCFRQRSPTNTSLLQRHSAIRTCIRARHQPVHNRGERLCSAGPFLLLDGARNRNILKQSCRRHRRYVCRRYSRRTAARRMLPTYPPTAHNTITSRTVTYSRRISGSTFSLGNVTDRRTERNDEAMTSLPRLKRDCSDDCS